MTTLKSVMADDVTDVFLDTDEFGDTHTRQIAGVTTNTEAVVGVFTQDALPGTNEVDGDGVTPSRKTGKRIRNSGMLEIANSQTIHKKDTWLCDGERWKFRRRMGRDTNMQTLLLTNIEGDKTRRSRLQAH